MVNPILSAFSDEYATELDEQISVLTNNGIGYIEPRIVNSRSITLLSAEERREMKKKLDDAGLRANAIGSPIGKIKLDEDFGEHLDLARRMFEMACEFDCKNVRIFSFYPAESTPIGECRNEVVDRLGELLTLADEYGLTLCHENEAKIYGESPEACFELMKIFKGKLRAVFDMGNFVLGSYPALPAYKLLRDYIEYFHIKDSLYEGAIVPCGKGQAHIGEIISEHRSYAKKDFFITYEPHLETFDGLHKLAGMSFDNPYKFSSAKEAFLEGLKCLKEVIYETV